MNYHDCFMLKQEALVLEENRALDFFCAQTGEIQYSIYEMEIANPIIN